MVAATASASAQSPAPQRIVAVGDLHGDYDAWIAIARDAGLIDGRNRWAGGNAILVQTGDIVDRGSDSLKIIVHLQRLQKAAPSAGGKVIVLVGNHEAMNVTGDLRYVHPGEFAAFADRDSERRRSALYEANARAIEAAYRTQEATLTPREIRAAWLAETPLGEIEHQAAWGPKGPIGRWVASLPAVARVGDTLFVHGGLSSTYAAMPIDEINRRVSAALEAGETSLTSIVNDPLGPLWYRGLITRGPAFEQEVAAAAAASGVPAKPRPPIDQELDLVLKAYDARRLVIAHTPNLGGIATTHGGRLIRIDTGISSHYGGVPSWLEILGDRVVPHIVQRSAR